jgi:hypothetical protein
MGEPMPNIKALKEQMERARRLAATMTSAEDRDRLRTAADDYQRQIDAASVPSDEVQGSDARDTQPDAPKTISEATPTDAAASSEESEPTTPTRGQSETD